MAYKDIVTEEHEKIGSKIEEILKTYLPSKTYIIVKNGISILGGHSVVKIIFSASDKAINGVYLQLPQIVSLQLDITDMELTVQAYAGSGGQRIMRKPNMNDPKEKYLAMKGVKIPFRQPKKELKFVYNAIIKFAENWIKALQENKEVLCYQDIVNYDEFLNS